MNGFEQFNLSPELQQSIAALGFETPTPVQKAVIPVLLEGRRNMVALAQTGTGKTAAFGIPVLQRVDTGRNDIQTVILCPTRELCLQVCRDLKAFAKHSKAVRSVAIYGGASIENQLRALRNGVHIIVATPGRLHDMLRRKGADLSLASCVVLDEADEMLSMGFEEDLNAIMAAIPEGVQKLLFSATMPRQVERLRSAYMKDALEITIGSRNAGAENVTHECYMIHEKDRYLALKRIVDSTPQIYGLIFCRTRVETQETAANLMKDGYSADALHGDLTQIQRDRVMAAFRDRTIRMLVATDVAARGIDVTDLTHVINYQLPDDLESYTHRSGRTGRAGKSGISVVLINMREKWKIKHIEQRLGKQFAFKPVPSGHAVCEAQLLQFMERAKAVKVNDPQIAPFMPAIFETLEGLTREQLIKHFASLELNRFLEYYRDTPDISSPVEQRPPVRSGRGDNRGGYSDRRIPQTGGRFAKPFHRNPAAHPPTADGHRRPPFRKFTGPAARPAGTPAPTTAPQHAKATPPPRPASHAATPQKPAHPAKSAPAAATPKKTPAPHKRPKSGQTTDQTPDWVKRMKQQPGQ
jgi:ATP-dependent RNA helicase DeaD